MKPEPLPPNLRELEGLLTRRPTPQPDAGMRDRILSAMTAEPPVAELVRVRSELKSHDFSYIWRVAAAVVLLLNLPMSIGNGFRFQSLQAHGPERQIPSDDRFLAFAATAMAQLTPAPDAGLVCQLFFQLNAAVPQPN